MTDTTISMPQKLLVKGQKIKKTNNKHSNRNNSYHALVT